MTLTEIATLRVTQQQLTTPAFKQANELVSWFGAVQAQEYALSKWALGLRLPHVIDTDIEQQFIKGDILRTHVLRPTWHFVAAEDIHWMIQLTAPRVTAINAYMYRKLELDANLFKRCNDILYKALEGNKQLTRTVLNEEFKKKKINADGIRLACIMMQAELEAIICSGAKEGKQFTYALLDERVQVHAPKNNEEALTELTKKYFKSRGPATVKDFSTWSGLTLTDCKKGIRFIEKNLMTETIQEETYYFFSESAATIVESKGMHLLPIYDEMIMGYKNRDPILNFSTGIHPAPSLTFDNTILSDSQIIGTWRRTLNKSSIDLEYKFFTPPTKKQFLEFEKAINRFEKFMGLNVNYLRRS